MSFAAALVLGACATAAKGPTLEEQANMRLAGDAVVVLPVQRVGPTAQATLPTQLASLSWPALRGSFDDTLRNAFVTRAIGDAWVWPAALRAAHRRNPLLLPDPFNLSVGALRGMRLEPDTDLPERLGGELRTLLGVSEGRRYFLLPLDVTVGYDANGFSAAGQVILIDGRRQRAVWSRRVSGPAAATVQAALVGYAGTVATLFAGSDTQ